MLLCGNSAKAADLVFDNTSETSVAGTSNTTLTTVWGDFVKLSQTGKLSAFKFAVFCSGSSSLPLTSATVNINFYDYTGGTIGNSFGSFSVNIGTLNQGFYADYTVQSLDYLNINLSSTDVLITQQLSNVVGATRMGVPTNTTSGASVGTNLTTGFYRIVSGTTTNNVILGGQTFSNLRYSVSIASVPEPSSMVLTALAMAASVGIRQRVSQRRSA